MRVRGAAEILLSACTLGGFLVGCGPIGGGASDDPSTIPDASSSGTGSLPAIGPDGGISMAPNGYYVQGNQVFDANGKPHVFRGMDRPSLEWSAGGDQLTPTDYQNMANLWHGNIVRLSLNEDFWLLDPSNPNYDQGYEPLVDEQVRWAEENGMDIILDLHWSDQGDYGKGNTCLTGGKGCQQCMADQPHSIPFWQQIATKYAHDGHVLFELYNEPHDVSWYTWLNGGTSGGSCSQNGGQNFQVAGMQQLYNTVRQTGAQNLVVIGGLNWAYDLTGVPGNRVQGYNIIYNTHPYAYKCGGTCSTNTFEGYFGFLAATDPVIATEFGDSDCSAGFYQAFTQYTQTKGIHWTAWAYYPGGCGFPGLINDWTGSPVMGSGTTVQAALMASMGPWQPMTMTTDAGSEGGTDGSVTGNAGGPGGPVGGPDGAADGAVSTNTGASTDAAPDGD